MDFDFSEQQFMFQKSVRDSLSAGYTLASLRDASSPSSIESTLWTTLADLGLFSLLVPVDYDGLGLDFVDLALVIEEFGRALVPPSVTDTLAMIDVIACHGSDDQKSAWLPRLLSGNTRVSCAIYEAESGYDVNEMRCTAQACDQRLSISGEKIMAAGADRADLLAVAVKLDDASTAIALIKPHEQGVQMERHETLDLSAEYFRIRFSDVQIAKADLLGAEVSSVSAMPIIDRLTTIASLVLVGICARLIDDTVAYARDRVQFDKPIGSFQAIKHKCADMAVALNSSRSVSYFAAWALATNAPEIARAISMAKAYCSDTARFVCREAIQIHGGMGFTWDMGLHFFTRRAKLLETSFGTADFHREKVLSETLLNQDMQA